MTRISDKWLKLVVKNNLVDEFKQTWTSMTEHSPKGDNYNLFKHDLKFEDYLDVLDDKDKFLLVKFRTSNHRLPIEVGRWRNIKRENRICNLCNGRNLGDEFHYLFECPSLLNERKKYFEPHFINRPNILKFCNLMNSKSVSVLCNSEHRELYSNMGMRMQHTIFLMMRLKSFRPEVDKSWQSRRECQN